MTAENNPNGLISESRIAIIEDTQFAKIVDDFSNDIYIKSIKVAGKEIEYIPTQSDSFSSILLALKSINGSPYLDICGIGASAGVIPLNKNDEIILLFEDQIKIHIVFSSKPSGSGGIKSSFIPLDFEMLNTLLRKRFLKWKYINNKTREYQIGAFLCNRNDSGRPYNSEEEGQYLLRFYTAKFIESNKTFFDSDSSKFTWTKLLLQ